MRPEIRRSIRNTIGDALSRAVARNPHKLALAFEDRRWTFAELNEAANRTANSLLELELAKGERVAAYGRNSDAYVILWLACARADLIHVPVNYALTGNELLYILDQSGSKALFHDPDLADAVEGIRDRTKAEIHGTLQDGDELDVLGMAKSGDTSEPDLNLDDSDVAQLLYTSGTTAAPKGAMMTHRALLSEYVSCIEALEFRSEDRALAALPL